MVERPLDAYTPANGIQGFLYKFKLFYNTVSS
jgi:hypothetical protein